jgi:hypothetical protein
MWRPVAQGYGCGVTILQAWSSKAFVAPASGLVWQKTRLVLHMNAPHELTHEEVLRLKLEVLRQKHRDLDEAIAALQAQGPNTALTVQRLKKEKLVLKDQIARIEDELTPDIIA